MTKPNLQKQKSKSKIQFIFDDGTKCVYKAFIAFFLHSQDNIFSSTIIASKKIGNAVKRNRAKRRLREIIRLHIEPSTKPIKLILLARRETFKADFSLLLNECSNLVKKINSK